MRKRYQAGIIAGVVLLLLTGAFILYVSVYYKADFAVQAIYQESNTVTEGNITVLQPESPSNTALIFYPGAKVDEVAYLPLLNEICQNGITCILVKMPFRLAFFNSNAAGPIIGQFPEIENWYLGGHSLGGAMASSYAAKNPERIAGLILLGSYSYGEFPQEKVLTVYGSNDDILDKTKAVNAEIIEGGNHANFGNYGQQKGDGQAAISREEQQKITVRYILKFMGIVS